MHTVSEVSVRKNAQSEKVEILFSVVYDKNNPGPPLFIHTFEKREDAYALCAYLNGAPNIHEDEEFLRNLAPNIPISFEPANGKKQPIIQMPDSVQ